MGHPGKTQNIEQVVDAKLEAGGSQTRPYDG